MDNPHLCNICKNQPPRSIRTGDTRVSFIFDLEKGLLFPVLPSKLCYKLEVWYADLMRARNASFGSLDYSDLLLPLTAPKI